MIANALIDLVRRSLLAGWVLVVGGLVLLALGSRAAPLVGQQPFLIRGASMTPAIPVGSMVLVQETAPEQIVVGDVITLAMGNGSDVTHRVIRVADVDGVRHFETKGDANASPDPTLVGPGQVAGVVEVSLPIAGYALAMLATPSGLVSVGSLLLASLLAIWLLDDIAAGRAKASRAGAARWSGSASSRSASSGPVVLLAAALLGGLLAGSRVPSSLALLTDSENNPSTFTTAASFGTTEYLQNNPTPPTGNTNSQLNLSMNTTVPTATTLYNYDQNRDAFAGLLIAKGATGVGETDPTKYQNWRTAIQIVPRTINGTVSFNFWSAIKDFGTGKRGVVTVFLRDFNPLTSTYTTIGSGTLDVADWQAGSGTWVNRILTFSVSNYTVITGRRIELKLIVDSNAGDDMWFAYDTATYPTRISIP